MKYRYVFFDLDGTLLETLNDILTAINTTLDAFHYPLHYDYESGKKLIGNGAPVMVRRALSPLNLSEEEIAPFFQEYLKNYLKYQGMTTLPFEGVVETLEKLDKMGVKLAIVTNKPQKMTDEITKKLLPDVFIEKIGQSERFRTKPDPEAVDYIVNKYGIDRKELLYVGDSKPDADLAENADVDCALFTSGYGNYTDELLGRVKYTFSEFVDLINIVE